VGIATDYGMDGPGIESPLGRGILYQSRPALCVCSHGDF
jgi:hypothetical protein